MEDSINQAKVEFVWSKVRLTKVLAVTPGDKINWLPSPTARTPIHEVAPVATQIEYIQTIYSDLDWHKA